MSNKVYFSEYKRSVNEALQDFIDLDFESVVLVGLKGSEVHFKTSQQEDTLKVLGSLEAAKAHVIDTWGN